MESRKRARTQEEEEEEVALSNSEEEASSEMQKRARSSNDEEPHEEEGGSEEEEEDEHKDAEEEGEEDDDDDDEVELKVLKLEQVRRTYWTPEVIAGPEGEAPEEAPSLVFDHRADLTCFGGVRPWLRADEEWPRCKETGCTGRLMQFFLQIDFRFAPAAAQTRFAGDDSNRLLQLFCCHTCRNTYKPFAPSVLVRFVPLPPKPSATGASLVALSSKLVAGSLESHPEKAKVLQDLETLGLEADITKAQPFLADITANEDVASQLAKRPRGDEDDRANGQFHEGHFPLKVLKKWVQHEDDLPNTEECEEIAGGEFTLEGMDPEEDPEDKCNPCNDCKLGGWAYWVQSVTYPKCKTCKKPMKNMVFNISRDDAIPYDWGDGGTGQILQCPEHLDVLAFTWAT